MTLDGDEDDDDGLRRLMGPNFGVNLISSLKPNKTTGTLPPCQPTWLAAWLRAKTNTNTEENTNKHTNEKKTDPISFLAKTKTTGSPPPAGLLLFCLLASLLLVEVTRRGMSISK